MKRLCLPVIGFVCMGLLYTHCGAFGGSTEPIAMAKTDEGEVSFSGTVMPILVDHCQRCHGEDRKGDLYVMDYAGVMKGGKSGSFVTAGDPDGSRLVTSVEKTKEPFMPPRIFPELTADRIAAIRQWIGEGAKEN